MDWFTVGSAGFVATTLMASLAWALHALSLTRFTPSVVLGCVFFDDPHRPVADTTGFVLLLLLGSSLVPAAYQWAFLSWNGPSALRGSMLGAAHGLAVAVLLPVVGTIGACIRTGRMPRPGVLGLAWGRLTPVAVVAEHMLYGASLGAILAAF